MNNCAYVVPIGTIGKSYKFSGEVHYFPYNIDSCLPKKNMDVWIGNEKNKVKVTLEYIHFRKNSNIMKIKGIDSRERARDIKNNIIYISRKQMPDLVDYEYYLFDLIGCDVFDLNDKMIGIVKDVLSLKANDVLILVKNNKEYLIPIINDVVKFIDIKNKKILIEVITGLLD